MYKVLLVDDEYMILNGLEMLIPWNELGFQITGKVRNGKQALEYVKNNSVDLVISDVTMPIKSGIQFIKEAREENFVFEVIMLSGYQEFEYVKEAMTLGANSYLVKPVDEIELESQLKAIKNKLDSQVNDEIQRAYLGEYLLKKWLHNESEIQEIFEFYHLTFDEFRNKTFTVLFLKDEKKQDEVRYCFYENQQKFVYYQEEEKVWISIFCDFEQKGMLVLNKLANIIENSADQYIVGATVDCFEEVPLSYEHAALQLFYARNQSMDFGTLGAVSAELPNLSFDKLNEVAKANDFDDITKEVDSILQKIQKLNVTPDYAKHLVFLLFVDLYRHFDFSEVLYQDYIHQIITSQHYEELAKVIDCTIQTIRENWQMKKYSMHITKIMSIVENEYDSDLNLKEISDRLFLNPVYAGQLFKRETGQSFSQYLNIYRVQKVQECLLNTDDSIGIIAIKTGYSTANYLSKNFRKVCGLTPKDYRSKYTKIRIN